MGRVHPGSMEHLPDIQTGVDIPALGDSHLYPGLPAEDSPDLRGILVSWIHSQNLHWRRDSFRPVYSEDPVGRHPLGILLALHRSSYRPRRRVASPCMLESPGTVFLDDG